MVLVSNLNGSNEIVDVGFLRKVFRIDDRMVGRIVGPEPNEPATLRMEDDRQDGDAVTPVVTLQKLVPDLETTLGFS